MLALPAAGVGAALLAAVFGASPQKSLQSTCERMQGVVDGAHWPAFALVPVSMLRTRAARRRPGGARRRARSLRLPESPVTIFFATLGWRHTVPSRIDHARAAGSTHYRLARTDWILTSPGVIEGRFAGGLRVGVIPMRVVRRGPFRGWGEPLVQHCPANQRRPTL